MSYNGWSNYETWAVKLWIDNEQGSQEYWLEQAAELSARDLEDALRDQHEEAAHDMLDSQMMQSSIFADLLLASFREVDWREIAESLAEDTKEAVEQ